MIDTKGSGGIAMVIESSQQYYGSRGCPNTGCTSIAGDFCNSIPLVALNQTQKCNKFIGGITPSSSTTGLEIRLVC